MAGAWWRVLKAQALLRLPDGCLKSPLAGWLAGWRLLPHCYLLIMLSVLCLGVSFFNKFIQNAAILLFIRTWICWTRKYGDLIITLCHWIAYKSCHTRGEPFHFFYTNYSSRLNGFFSGQSGVLQRRCRPLIRTVKYNFNNPR